MKLVRAYADDACVCAGVSLIGIGVFQLSPVATWFYAGASLILAGVWFARGLR